MLNTFLQDRSEIYDQVKDKHYINCLSTYMSSVYIIKHVELNLNS